MDCYIVGAGDFYGFVKRPAEDDCVIAADGGFAVCQAEGVKPRWTLGDFDSLGCVPQTENVVQMPVEKDDTDMVLAVKKGLELGCKTFHIYGGTGGRLDHTVANLQTLLYLKNHGAEGYLYDHNGYYTVLKNEKKVFDAREKGILSVFAMNGDAKGVTIAGGQYPAENAVFTCDVVLGVSNHFIGNAISVEVLDGTLLVGVLEE